MQVREGAQVELERRHLLHAQVEEALRLVKAGHGEAQAYIARKLGDRRLAAAQHAVRRGAQQRGRDNAAGLGAQEAAVARDGRRAVPRVARREVRPHEQQPLAEGGLVREAELARHLLAAARPARGAAAHVARRRAADRAAAHNMSSWGVPGYLCTADHLVCVSSTDGSSLQSFFLPDSDAALPSSRAIAAQQKGKTFSNEVGER